MTPREQPSCTQFCHQTSQKKLCWMQACGLLEKTTFGQEVERETEARHRTEAKATRKVLASSSRAGGKEKKRKTSLDAMQLCRCISGAL